jgi:hypothetical protein
MTTTRKNTSKTFTLVGGGVGLALFLAVGLLPSILYGGYAGVLLAGGLFGTPVEASLVVRALIVVGMVIGVAAVASLFAALGGAAGAGIATLTQTRGTETEVEGRSTVEVRTTVEPKC